MTGFSIPVRVARREAHVFGAFLACVWCNLVNSTRNAPKTTHSQHEGLMEALKQGADALFILLGGIMVLAMHAGFAFLELGTVRRKNQVNALVKILVDFSVSTVVYFVVGYAVAYGTSFFVGAEVLAAKNGYEL